MAREDLDEEIARAIRRDPRFLIRIAVLLTVLVVLIGVGLVAFGRLRIGEHVARGFETVTETPPAAPADAP